MAETPNTPAGAPPNPASTPAGAPQKPEGQDLASLLTSMASKFDDFKNDVNTRLSGLAETTESRFKRLKAKDGDPATPANPAMEELEGLRKQNDELKKRQDKWESDAKRSRLDAALARTLAATRGLRDGATEDLVEMLGHKLEEDSQGNPVIKRNGAFVPLSDVIGEYAAKPTWQAPANRGGGGKPGNALPSGGGPAPRIVSLEDVKAGRVSLEDLASGKVAVAAD